MIIYRLKRMLVPHLTDIDEDNEHYLVGGAGYEYLQTINKGKVSRENRIVIQATPAFRPGAGLLLSDRNRVEFRRVNGDESVRYRNKLTVIRAFQAHHFRFTPYASGELFYASNHHSWNENQYAFGVQLPYKQRLMVDTYYLRQNCTTCGQNPLNVWGVNAQPLFLEAEVINCGTRWSKHGATHFIFFVDVDHLTRQVAEILDTIDSVRDTTVTI